jgi:hypothetical protein
MKVEVLYDVTGAVHAIMQPLTDLKGPVAAFTPAVGQRVATLDVPQELQQHKLLDLHASVFVDLSGASPRLAASHQKPA